MFLFRMRIRVLPLVLLLLAAAGLQGCSRADEGFPALAAAPDPAQAQQFEKLNRLADELYRQSGIGDLAPARDKLQTLGRFITGVSFEGAASVEGVNALTETVTEANRRFNAARISPEGAVKAAAKLKLAADALSHPNEPIWMQYYKLFAEDTRLLEAALNGNSIKDAQSRFQSIQDRYDTIRPAVWISRTPSEGEKMDSILRTLGSRLQSSGTKAENLLSLTKQWKEALDELFRKQGDRTAYLPVAQPDDPFKWSLTIGSLIISVLGYAAWRMFQSDRNLVRRPRRTDDR